MANESRTIAESSRIKTLAKTIKDALTQLEVIYQDRQRNNFDTTSVQDQAAFTASLQIDDQKKINSFLDEAHNVNTGPLGDRLSDLT